MKLKLQTNNNQSSIIDNHLVLPSTSVENLLQINLFLQNKANIKIGNMNLSQTIIKGYKNLWLYKSQKQSQNKANSNPIQSQNKPNSRKAKIDAKSVFARDYEEICGLRLCKNKAKTNPTGAKRKS